MHRGAVGKGIGTDMLLIVLKSTSAQLSSPPLKGRILACKNVALRGEGDVDTEMR